MQDSLPAQVNALYTTYLSPEWAVRFFDDRSTLHYSVVQLPFGGTWNGTADAGEYRRRWQATLALSQVDFELENYDEAFGTFTVRTTVQGRWKRTGQPAAFSERHFGELRAGKIRRLTAIVLAIDPLLSGYFTRAERLVNDLMRCLLQQGAGPATLDLVADDFVYIRPPTREAPQRDDIIHAQERRGKAGFANFFADLFGKADLQFGNHRFLYADHDQAVVRFPFTRFTLRATGVEVTGEDVACYDRLSSTLRTSSRLGIRIPPARSITPSSTDPRHRG